MKEQKQNKERKTKNQEKGITLIALAVTIVVLIILATITINGVFNENGFIRRAMEGKNLWENSIERDREETNSFLEEDVVTPSGSEDGQTVPIPFGFVPSKATGEKSVSDGFVIYEGTEDVTDRNVEEARKTRDQFVWVPVNYDEYKNAEGYTDSYDEKSQKEAQKIEESIKEYGGFFIGRYETGINDQNKAVVTKDKQTYTGETLTNAIEISKNMYTEDNRAYGATSSLLSGRQWDTFLNKVKDKVDINNSSNWGNYCTNDGIGRKVANLTKSPYNMKNGYSIQKTYFDDSTGGMGGFGSIFIEAQMNIEDMTVPYNTTHISETVETTNYEMTSYLRIVTTNYFVDLKGEEIPSASLSGFDVKLNENNLFIANPDNSERTRAFYYKKILQKDDTIDNSFVLNIPINRTKNERYISFDILIDAIQSKNMYFEDLRDLWGVVPQVDENGNIIAVQTNFLNNNNFYFDNMIFNNNYSIQKTYFYDEEYGGMIITQTPNRAEKTGTSDSWKVNNVYDLAGNVEEWTNEKSSTNGEFSIRGGKYYDNGDPYYVSSRKGATSDEHSEDIGFRTVLYIKVIE